MNMDQPSNASDLIDKLEKLHLRGQLRSFRYPSNIEREFFLDLIARGEKELLQQENEDLTILLQRVRSILSPIRKLPNELLLECLMHYLDYGSIYMCGGIPRLACRLCLVCHHFQDLILSCKPIWSSISAEISRFSNVDLENLDEVEDDIHGEEADEKALHMVEPVLPKLLQRSASHPLKVDIYVDSRTPGRLLSKTPIFKLLNSHKSPWKSLCITCEAHITADVLRGICRAMKDIEELEIRYGWLSYSH
ncbi:hypothetical protein BT96DRAFT_370 [Gymnopus androsaceus JB14]|uniref:F-box domain-containing protein n=1 Tax=Gymnopus androsaceus JB14 TaxID=1447944 RepID=A0A6A4IFP8_9AGAR|nr:hypothetical protein BT96DRAFT_370 [Gymnopus androsaceus JB14]